MAKTGPKPLVFDKEVLQKIEDYAARQWLERDIAAFLNYSPNYFSELKSKNPEISEAIKRGTQRGIDEAVQTLQRAMKQDNIGAAIFFLKCKAGWRENANNGNGDSARDQESVKQSIRNALRRLSK